MEHLKTAKEVVAEHQKMVTEVVAEHQKMVTEEVGELRYLVKVEEGVQEGHQKKLEDVEQVLTSMVMVAGPAPRVRSVGLVKVEVRVVLKLASARWGFSEAEEAELRR